MMLLAIASTGYQFDDMGRLVWAISPDTGQTRYWYDPNGNLLGKVDARGVRVEYSYDPLNRLTQIQDTTSTPTVLVSYYYDGANPHGLAVSNGIGRLTGMADQSGTTTWSYDKRGNIILEKRTIGSQTFAIGYTWDANGNLASMTYPSGRVVTYQYDSVNVDRVASVFSGTTVLANNIQWEPFGDVKSMTYGNGVTESVSRDYRGQVTQMALTSGATTLLDRYYTYDPVGNILGWREAQPGGQNQNFFYDELNRIVSASGPYGEIGWSYDSVGNRLTEGTSSKGLNIYYYSGNRLTATSDPSSRLKRPPGELFHDTFVGNVQHGAPVYSHAN